MKAALLGTKRVRLTPKRAT